MDERVAESAASRNVVFSGDFGLRDRPFSLAHQQSATRRTRVSPSCFSLVSAFVSPLRRLLGGCVRSRRWIRRGRFP